MVNCRPLTTALASETFEVVDVVLCLHDHLKRRDEFRAGRAVASRAEQPTYMHQLQLPLSTTNGDLRAFN